MNWSTCGAKRRRFSSLALTWGAPVAFFTRGSPPSRVMTILWDLTHLSTYDMYICIERERERKKERKRWNNPSHIYIHVYIHVCIHVCVYIYIHIIYHISIDRWDNEPLFFCGTLARCLSGKHINFEAVEKSAVGEYSHPVLLSLRSKPILWKP